MQDLGTVPNDFWSIAIGINDQGQIVGASANTDFSVVSAFVRQTVDLNRFVAGSTPLFLENACKIDSRGEIDGVALDPRAGYIHAYLAIPTA